MYKVFIDGREGTTGLRIQERLSGRDDIELLEISEDKRKDPSERARLINSSDVTFLCLPDAAAIEAVSLVSNPEVRIIDASTAHRTLEGWSYGLPELSAEHRARIRLGKRTAVPGCHASGFIMLVYPLVREGIIDKNSLLSCVSVTGYSGGGKKMIAEYESDSRSIEYSAPRQYGFGQTHKHLKEMVAVTGLVNAPVFAPIVADYYSGMSVTVPLHQAMLKRSMNIADLTLFFKEYYAGEPMIRTADQPNYLSAVTMSGKDSVILMAAGNDDRMTLTACYDNLGKGASGAAVQCMNIMLGIDELKSLSI